MCFTASAPLPADASLKDTRTASEQQPALDRASSSSSSLDAQAVEEVAETMQVPLHRAQGMKLGAAIAKMATSDEVVIVAIGNNGMIPAWNEQNPTKAISIGDIVVAVNGKTASVQVLEEIGKCGSMMVSVLRDPTRPQSWKDAVASLGKQVTGSRQVKHGEEAQQASKQCIPTNTSMSQFGKDLFVLPSCAAGDAGVHECAICCEDVEAHEKVVHLPCGHGFHVGCMVKWMQQKKGCVCPLCRHDLKC